MPWSGPVPAGFAICFVRGERMFSLTSYERKVLLIVSAVILSGAFLRMHHSPSGPVTGFSSSDRQVSVNVNTASLDELILLPSIGEKTAARIIEYRRSHGNFEKPEDLTGVRGIGPGKLKLIRPLVVF